MCVKDKKNQDRVPQKFSSILIPKTCNVLAKIWGNDKKDDVFLILEFFINCFTISLFLFIIFLFLAIIFDFSSEEISILKVLRFKPDFSLDRVLPPIRLLLKDLGGGEFSG